MNEWLKT